MLHINFQNITSKEFYPYFQFYDKHTEYYNCKKPFTVDGYDKTSKTVYLFQGCYWHGCRKCHPEKILNITKQWNKLIY